MEYVKYGNAGIEVSRICLGAMTFYERMEEQEAIDLVRRCLDAGVNFIDTAESYGRGASEQFLAKALKGVRENVIIATKVFSGRRTGRRRGADCSRLNVIRAVDKSLRDLGTDYIDIYMCHHPDPRTSFEETYSTLDGLVKQGKIRYLGMCNAYAWQVAHCLGLCANYGWEPPVSLQFSYNLIDRVGELETLPMTNRFNLVCQTYGPQAGGLLTGKYQRGQPLPEGSRAAKMPFFAQRLTDDVFDLLEEMERMAAKYDITMGQLSVCWILSRPGLFVPIIGGSRAEHIEPLLKCPEIEIEQEDLDKLTEMSERYIYKPWGNQPNSSAPSPALNWV